MIPEDIVEFLEGATVAIGGTRDGNLVPHVHRVSGWFVSPDRQTITCLVSDAFSMGLMESLEDNGQFALTVCEMPSHETYQIKGDYVGSRTLNESDLRIFKQCQTRFAERIVSLFGYTEEASSAFVAEPATAVSFRVREVFLQTPGPGAGRRIIPGEE
jgi:hypothetical protein